MTVFAGQKIQTYEQSAPTYEQSAPGYFLEWRSEHDSGCKKNH